MTIFAGIDPGLSGAIAFYSPDAPTRIDAFDLPVVAGVIDGRNLAEILRRFMPGHVLIEDVHSMPKQGVSSTFKFGRAFGTAIGIVEGVGCRVSYIHASRWKRHYSLDSEAEKSRRAALDHIPASCGLFARKKDHNRAEAALLAHYAAHVWRAAERAAA